MIARRWCTVNARRKQVPRMNSGARRHPVHEAQRPIRAHKYEYALTRIKRTPRRDRHQQRCSTSAHLGWCVVVVRLVTWARRAHQPQGDREALLATRQHLMRHVPASEQHHPSAHRLDLLLDLDLVHVGDLGALALGLGDLERVGPALEDAQLAPVLPRPGLVGVEHGADLAAVVGLVVAAVHVPPVEGPLGVAGHLKRS
mmetsp:Transcript_42560/g.96105  ORF Transcript_42560/g.96105 Transcript_42560/m.96105 type:complete len:200 (-) Transcript_42560:953-1552(-)